MKHAYNIALAIIVIALIVFAIALVRGDEDYWSCQNGTWSKHGNPSAAMPTTPCIMGNPKDK